ncbi:MAG: DUF4956 domain-containing protein [Gemmatimonadota bacterium]
MQDFLATQQAQIPLIGFLINLVLAAVLCFILGRIYVVFGSALSNRRAFAQNFIILGMTTMVIITVVKSSLALSLGLVGALSIVRFRAAIKEPEELAYLFLVIAVGLGLGADQRLITLIAFMVIVAVVWVKSRWQKPIDVRNLHLTISLPERDGTNLSAIVGVLEKHCSELSLSRFDEGREALEASFLVDLAGYSELQAATTELRRLDGAMKVTFVDYEGLGG